LDVAGFGGDENALALRRGMRALPLILLEPGKSEEVAGRAIRAIRKVRRDPSERPTLRIDANGVGFGVWSLLVSDGFEWDGEVFHPRNEVDAIGVNVGESASDSETYANLRAEAAFTLKEWIEAGGSLDPDELLDEELRASKYALDRYNRILVEPKIKIRGRLGRSPDRADAVALATLGFDAEPVDTTVYRTKRTRSRRCPAPTPPGWR
jgi:hypothetical protein